MIKNLFISMLVVMSTSVMAFNMKAYWTGQSQQTTTITGMPGWMCEYDYLGKKFWVTSRNFCPSWIDVQ
jgi:hypothetical protein